MAIFNTGVQYGTSATTIIASGWADDTWVNVSKLLDVDSSGAYIIATTFDTSDQSYVAKAVGFNMAAIPDEATIEGVVCNLRAWWRTGQGAATLGLAQLLQPTSSQLAGSNICETVAARISLSSNVSSLITLGNGSNKWGCALTPAWVKDPRFGIGLGCWSIQANTDVDIAWVNLNIYYTSAGTTSVASYFLDNTLGISRGISVGVSRGMR